MRLAADKALHFLPALQRAAQALANVETEAAAAASPDEPNDAPRQARR